MGLKLKDGLGQFSQPAGLSVYLPPPFKKPGLEIPEHEFIPQSVTRRFPFRPMPGLGGLGSTPEELRVEANEAAILRLYNNMKGTAGTQFQALSGSFDSLANLGAAIRGGGDFTAQLDAVYNSISSIASLVPVYGTAISALLRVMNALTQWLASAIPSMPDSCNTYPKQAAQHYARVKWGLSLTPDEAAARVYRDEKLFFARNVLYRRRATSPYYPAPSCFWIWHDYPMAAPPGARLIASPLGESVRMVQWTDAFMSNTNYTMRVDATGDLAARKQFLSVATRPVREFPAPISPASGYRDWFEYLEEHPDYEGSAAAVAAGDRVVDRLMSDGRAEYMGWGYDSSYLGDRSWLSGFFFRVEGLDDETIFGLLRWFSSLPTADLPDGVVLPNDMMVIPPEDPSVGNGWGWHPGFDYFLRDFILNNGVYMPYHYSVLLSEYKRRRDAGIWTIRMPGSGTLIRALPRTSKSIMRPKKETGLTTGEIAVASVGVAAVVAGVTKLLKVW